VEQITIEIDRNSELKNRVNQTADIMAKHRAQGFINLSREILCATKAAEL